MEEIATEASVSRATLYLHFPGKPSLLEALLLEDWAGQIRLFERLRAVDLSDSEQLSRWLMRVAEGMRLARDSFGIHRAALGQNPELTLKHQHHRTMLAELLLQAIAATGSRADLARAIEAELIVAEIEYFAIAAAIGWSADQFATALPLVTDRLRAFARSAG